VNQCLRTLDMRACGVSTDEATVLARALCANETLTELNLNSNSGIGPEGVKALADMMTTNVTLKKMLLWGSLKESSSLALSPGAPLVEALPMAHLEELDLGFYGVSQASGPTLQAALRDTISLRTLLLKKCGLLADTISLLSEGLAVNSSLTLLDLSDNGFGQRGGVSLAAALNKNRTLQQLILVHTAVGDVGAEALVEMLEDNSVLTELVLDEKATPGCTVLPPKGVALLERNRLGGTVVLTVCVKGTAEDGLPQVTVTSLSGKVVASIAGIDSLAALRKTLAETFGYKDARLLTPAGSVLEPCRDGEHISSLVPP